MSDPAKLTVIITASTIPSNPSIKIIKETIESLKHLGTQDFSVILAHDCPPIPNERYNQYLINLRDYVEKLADANRYKIVVRETHGCLTGNIRYAISKVDPSTKYILIVQHDLPFIRSLKIDQVISDMQINPILKCIRFNKRMTIKAGWDRQN